MGTVLVIGCLSLDTIHLDASGERKTYNTVGGAGLFTAMAAANAGADVTLYAPKPNPLPGALEFFANKLNWIGPIVKPDELPRLEIVHHGEGRATLLGAAWGPEQQLTCQDLADRIGLEGGGNTIYDTVHIAALSSAARQMDFLRFMTESKAAKKISAGTYARAIAADGESVRALMLGSDYFFMNRNEAGLLFGDGVPQPAANQLVFVTDGQNGARIYAQGGVTDIAADQAGELDPTGAGDTFCGATLAALGLRIDRLQAGLQGARLAARVIEHPGSQYYLQAK